MELHQFDSDQVKRASKVLQACGMESTVETLQALAETATLHYPNDPESLEKAARSLVEFFQGSSAVGRSQDHSWTQFRLWAVSVLRL